MVLNGYSPAGTLVASQTFPYSLTRGGKQGMRLGKPNPQFRNLKNVTFSLDEVLTSRQDVVESVVRVVGIIVVDLMDSVSITA